MQQPPLNEGLKLDTNGKVQSTAWNQWFNNAQKTSTTITYANTGGVPTQPPGKIGDLHVDTKSNTIYIGVDNQSVAGWVTGTGGGRVGPQGTVGPIGPIGPQGPTGSSGGITPGGTGFAHVTGGSLDATARNPILSSSDFANQGTTTTVLHGDALTYPFFSTVKSADIDSTAYGTTSGTICQGNDVRLAKIYPTASLFLGYNSGNPTAVYDVGIGGSSLTNDLGGYNVGIGVNALYNNITGQYCVAIGSFSCLYNTVGWNNFGLGASALLYNSTGNNNIGIGTNALKGQSGVSISNDIAIGYGTGQYTTSNGCIFIGNGAGANNTTNNRLMIDTSSTNTPLIDGDFSGRSVTINGNLTAQGNLYLPANTYTSVYGANGDLSIGYDGTYGQIVTDGHAASDLRLTCGANKTLELEDVVYEDLQFATSTGKLTGNSVPTWNTFTPNTSMYSFAVNDDLDLTTSEVPHKWVEGTSADVHIHVALKNDQTSGSNQYAKFSLFIGYADRNTVWQEVTLTAELTIPTGTLALTHLYLDMGDLTLTGLHVGTQIVVRVQRIAATGGTELTGKIFITQVGMHFQENTIGSRFETSK